MYSEQFNIFVVRNNYIVATCYNSVLKPDCEFLTTFNSNNN